MDNGGRSWQQVAAEAKVPAERAMIACYLSNLSRAGRSMEDAANLLRKGRGEVRTIARDWGLRFSDYSPAPQPLLLTWLKPKRGRWELAIDGALIAEAVAAGDDGYKARRIDREWHRGSTAEIAIRRLSEDMERDCLDLFGVDDVVIVMKQDGFTAHQVAPAVEDRAETLRRALGDA